MTAVEKSAAFRALHVAGDPFVIANAWDAGSARILEGLGFKAIATTSSGFAMTKGRKDYNVSHDAAIDHCREVAAAIDIPVSADLENGWGDAPDAAAETIARAVETGLAGGSIEDSTGDPANPIYDLNLAADRIAAASEAARASSAGFVLTARAEAYLWSKPSLNDVIARLQRFEAAGADVLFAPGLPDMDAVRAVCAAVTKPVNVLVLGKLAQHSLADFAAAGAARISVGGALARVAYATLADAKAILDKGAFDCLGANPDGGRIVSAFLREGNEK